MKRKRISKPTYWERLAMDRPVPVNSGARSLLHMPKWMRRRYRRDNPLWNPEGIQRTHWESRLYAKKRK